MKKLPGNLLKASSVTFVLSAALILLVTFGTTSCCFDAASLVSSLADSSTSENNSINIFNKSIEQMLEEAGSVSNGWIKDGYGKLVWEPSSVMNLIVSQDTNTEKYFDMAKPVFFSVESDLLAPPEDEGNTDNGSGGTQGSSSAENSSNSDSGQNSSGSDGSSTDNSSTEEVEFTWDFGNGETAQGQSAEYKFEQPGVYTITLTASVGNASDAYVETIWVAEKSGNFFIFNKYDCNVEVESIFTNNGPGKLLDTVYSLDVPKTIAPFQEVVEIITEPGKFKEKSGKNGDLFYTFYLGETADGETASVKADYKVIMSEFALNENTGDSSTAEDEDFDKIVKEYTKSEKSIDSDSKIIKAAAADIIGQETEPMAVAEKLYNYVIDNMEYDWERYAAVERENLLASELLDIKKGVCEDYSVLYAALCRAAGIPIKYVVGLPVMTLAMEEDNQLESGHAWNEIYFEGYGWIPVDPTSEVPFLSTNALLNLRSYSEFQPKALGYSWSYEDRQPGFSQECFYRVSGFDKSRMAAITMEEYQTMKNDTLSGN